MEIKAQEDYKTAGKKAKSISIDGKGTLKSGAADGKDVPKLIGADVQNVQVSDGLKRELEILDKGVQEAELAGVVLESGKGDQKEVSRDQSRLSEEARFAGDTREWDAAEEFKIWQGILGWTPGQGGDIEKELLKLMDAYIRVLESVLNHTYGQGLVERLDKLDQILICKLEQLLHADISELHDFMVKYGPGDSLMRLRGSLFYGVTGKYLSPSVTKEQWESFADMGGQIADRSLHTQRVGHIGGNPPRTAFLSARTVADVEAPESVGKAWTAQRETQIKSAGFRAAGTTNLRYYSGGGNPGADVTGDPAESFSHTGAGHSAAGIRTDLGAYNIYTRSGKAQSEPLYQRIFDYAKEDLERVQYIRKRGIVNQKPTDRYYPIRDLERAQRFVLTITRGGGNLFEKPQFTADNPCLKGVLDTVMKSKALLFISEDKPGRAMSQDMKLSMEKMCVRMNDRKKRDVAYEEDYSHIYRYAVKGLQSGMRLNKAVRSSIYYALKYFYESQKKEETHSQESTRAFFTESKEREDSQKDVENGLKVLEEDWKKYLKNMGYGGGDNYILGLLPYSYWGVFEEPERGQDQGPVTKAVQARVLWTMLFIIAAVVIFVISQQ